jgi:hypothetical protein
MFEDGLEKHADRPDALDWFFSTRKALVAEGYYNAEGGINPQESYCEKYTEQLEESKKPGRFLRIYTVSISKKNPNPIFRNYDLVYRGRVLDTDAIDISAIAKIDSDSLDVSDNPDYDSWELLSDPPPPATEEVDEYIYEPNAQGRYIFYRDDLEMLFYASTRGVWMKVAVLDWQEYLAGDRH